MLPISPGPLALPVSPLLLLLAVGRGLPTTLLHDAQGRSIDTHFGVLDAAALESRLRNLRAAPARDAGLQR